jgi:hypothetical protein
VSEGSDVAADAVPRLTRARLARTDSPAATSQRKRPAFQFYPGDWLRDMALRSCSMEARGLWIEMLCLMHDAVPYGHLRMRRFESFQKAVASPRISGPESAPRGDTDCTDEGQESPENIDRNRTGDDLITIHERSA